MDLQWVCELRITHMLAKRVAEGLFLACVHLMPVEVPSPETRVLYGSVCGLLAVGTCAVTGFREVWLACSFVSVGMLCGSCCACGCLQRNLYLLGLPDDAYTFGAVAYSELAGCLGQRHAVVCELENSLAVSYLRFATSDSVVFESQHADD